MTASPCVSLAETKLIIRDEQEPDQPPHVAGAVVNTGGPPSTVTYRAA
jgi:hypothetical protein